MSRFHCSRHAAVVLLFVIASATAQGAAWKCTCSNDAGGSINGPWSEPEVVEGKCIQNRLACGAECGQVQTDTRIVPQSHCAEFAVVNTRASLPPSGGRSTEAPPK
jgi:hypothetical protein